MLTETVFQSEDLAPKDRFDCWRERMAQTLAPMDMTSSYTDDFAAHMRLLDLGDVRVWPTTFRPMRFERGPRLIRHSDPELYHLTYVQHGALEVSQASREAVHGRHGLYVVDSSLPFDVRVVEEPQLITAVGIEVPKALLRLPGNGVGELLVRPMSGREGIGALLGQLLAQLAADTSSYRSADGPHLGQVVLDLLSALFVHELDADGFVTPESRQRTLLLRVRAFIQRHLADPRLTPRAIAGAHHISLSYLHRLFRTGGDGVSVAAWIRGQRLERARRDLADPALRGIPVHRIGARSGFTDPAVFSRAFRDAYGLPPGDYRRRQQRGDAASIDCVRHVNDGSAGAQAL